MQTVATLSIGAACLIVARQTWRYAQRATAARDYAMASAERADENMMRMLALIDDHRHAAESNGGSPEAQVFYLRGVLWTIAGGIPFRGVSDPREVARRTVERDWPSGDDTDPVWRRVT